MSRTTLSEIISEIYFIYENLNQLADMKTEVLKINDIKALNSIVQQEEAYNKKILQLLEKRDEYFANNNEITPEERRKVNIAAAKLKKVTDEFSVKNQHNQELVQQSLHYINMNLNILAPQEDSDTYSPQNKSNNQSMKPKRVFMDSRV